MTRALYRKTLTGFAPADDDAHRYWDQCPLGEERTLTFTKSRSYPQLKMYWAICKIAFDNHQGGKFNSIEEVSDSIKLACGLSRTVHIKFNGYWFERKTPASIAFDSLDQDKFNAFLEKALDYICAELIPGLDRATLVMEAKNGM